MNKTLTQKLKYDTKDIEASHWLKIGTTKDAYVSSFYNPATCIEYEYLLHVFMET